MRRIGFVVSACGMAFAVMPLATVLRGPDFTVALVGFALLLLGVFVAIESVSKRVERR